MSFRWDVIANYLIILYDYFVSLYVNIIKVINREYQFICDIFPEKKFRSTGLISLSTYTDLIDCVCIFDLEMNSLD